MNFTEPWHQEEWLKCAKSFEYFAKTYLRIRTLEGGLVPFELFNYQKRVLKEFQSNKYNIVRKFRQGGLTTLAVLWAVWLCTFRTDKQILLISKTDSEAIKAGKTAVIALDFIRDNHPWLYPELKEHSKHNIRFAATNSEIEFGNVNRARGQALNYIIIDEAAFIKNMHEAWAAMYPTVSTGGNVLVISTVNGMGNWYQQMYYDAKAGRNYFRVIDIDYREHPRYQKEEWVKEALANLGQKKFAQEVEGSFLDSGETYINTSTLTRIDKDVRSTSVVKKLFSEWDSEERLFELHKDNDDPNLHTWDKGALWIWKEPNPYHEYVIGVDAAVGAGEGSDNSVFQVIDTTSMEQVGEFSSNNVPPKILAMLSSRIGHYYNNALVVVEAGPYGLPVLDALLTECNYDNVYHETKGSRDRAGVTVSHGTRSAILDNMRDYLHDGTLKIYSQRTLDELNTFIVDRAKKRPQARKDRHDDTIMALAVALEAHSATNKSSAMDFTVNNARKMHYAREYDQIKKEVEETLSANAKDSFVEEMHETVDILSHFGRFGYVPNFERQNNKILNEFGW